MRDPSASLSQELSQLPRAEQTRSITIKLDAAVGSDAGKATEVLESKYGIKTLDVVIANAGIGRDYTGVLNVKAEEIRDHFEVNALGK